MRSLASSCIFGCRPLTMPVGGCRGEAGPDPAFSLLRSSLLANPEAHG